MTIESVGQAAFEVVRAMQGAKALPATSALSTTSRSKLRMRETVEVHQIVSDGNATRRLSVGTVLVGQADADATNMCRISQTIR